MIGLAIVLVLVSTGLVIAYKKLEGNINAISIGDALGQRPPETVEVEGPKKPLNMLVMGSDNRDGTNIGGDTPGLSDTTILLHLSADRKRAYGVSIPRDAMVERPECTSKNGKGTVPGGLTQFNAAYAVGGPAVHHQDRREDHRHPHRPLRGDQLRRLQGDGQRRQRRPGLRARGGQRRHRAHPPAGRDLQGQRQPGARLRARAARHRRRDRRHRPDEAAAGLHRRDGGEGRLEGHPGQPGAPLQLPGRRHEVADHRHRVRPPQGAGLPRHLAEEHRPGQHQVHHRAQRGLRPGPQPAPAGARGSRRCGARSASTARSASSAPKP